MSIWAKPGMKCVCVDDGERSGFAIMPVTKPIRGSIYTIRDVVIGHGTATGKVGLLLEEIQNPISPTWGTEYGFFIDRFRPLVTKTQEQDIEMFLSLLTKQNETA